MTIDRQPEPERIRGCLVLSRRPSLSGNGEIISLLRPEWENLTTEELAERRAQVWRELRSLLE